ncbi:MAG: potassium channel family protein [Candidatus Aenigmarchaeota archaeon]|nr:potassium channel family protein [Candidatus Aenigmarchaeota archaeon]
MVKAILKEAKDIEKEIEKGAREVRIRVIAALSIFILLILAGGLVYSKIECYPGTLQHWTYLDGVYFSAMTVTTVGYGDLVPTTKIGKIFTVFYSFVGIAVALYVLFVIGRFLMYYKIVLIKRGERKLIRSKK